jgi:hypothetical protein
VKAGPLSAVLLLGACSGPSPSDTATSQPKQDAVAGDTIECAVGGAAYFERVCKVEEARPSGGKILVVRHPDGGFRRFEVLTDGHGLATADGAEEAETAVVDGQLQVAVGADRYRFPATIQKHGGAE